jgi:hypothetical protein
MWADLFVSIWIEPDMLQLSSVVTAMMALKKNLSHFPPQINSLEQCVELLN